MKGSRVCQTHCFKPTFRILQLHARGKVRDIYAVGDDLLLITTDRISAFDHILATGIPDKGKILHTDFTVLVPPSRRPGADPLDHCRR